MNAQPLALTQLVALLGPGTEEPFLFSSPASIDRVIAGLKSLPDAIAKPALAALVGLAGVLEAERSPRAAAMLQSALIRSPVAVRLLVLLDRDAQQARQRAARMLASSTREMAPAKAPPGAAPSVRVGQLFGSDLDRRRVTRSAAPAARRTGR